MLVVVHAVIVLARKVKQVIYKKQLPHGAVDTRA